MDIQYSRRWVALTDAPNFVLRSLDEFEEEISITATQVEGDAPCGFRRMILEQATDRLFFRETGQFRPMTPELHMEMIGVYEPRVGGYQFDWPHLQVENDTAGEQAMRTRLVADMEKYQIPFEIIGLQRRFIWYSGMNGDSIQQLWIGMATPPTMYPFTASGKLKALYRGSIGQWGSKEEAAGVKPPLGLGKYRVLYAGPAWALRVRVDNQNPLYGHCTMFVDDEGHFICSDWCQRQDYTSYHGGVNLQTGLYMWDTWLMESALQNAQAKGLFKPSRPIRRAQVRKLITEEKEKVALNPVVRHLRSLAGQPALDMLVGVVKVHIAQHPTMDREERASLLLRTFQVAFKNRQADLIGGVRLRVPAVHLNGVLGTRGLAVLVVIGKPCVVGYFLCIYGHVDVTEGHTHLNYSFEEKQVRIDVEATIGALLSEIDRQQGVVAEPITEPITAKVLAQAEAIFRQQPRIFRFEKQRWAASDKGKYAEFLSQTGDKRCVIRKENGHVYSYDPTTGDTTRIEDEGFRDIAQFFFGEREANV